MSRLLYMLGGEHTFWIWAPHLVTQPCLL
uniref:Uncharacterized protein n=1 Tax=Arundo donax TaxID=35708 RepID=A0A0A9A180_ARUDO